MNPSDILGELLDILRQTKKRQTFMQANGILELLIAHYFNGNNYTSDYEEWSREDSKIMAYALLNTLQFNEMVLERDKK